MDKEEYKKWIRERISFLRLQKGVSEYQMSLDLGLSRTYINNITVGKVMPSLDAFLDICDYFELTPAEFFDDNVKYPMMANELIENYVTLDESDQELYLNMVKRTNMYYMAFKELNKKKTRGT